MLGIAELALLLSSPLPEKSARMISHTKEGTHHARGLRLVVGVGVGLELPRLGGAHVVAQHARDTELFLACLRAESPQACLARM